MTSVLHHPSDETLARHAAGTLPVATRLVIASHIEGCRRCADQVRRYEAIGGSLLEAIEETQLGSDVLVRTLAMIDGAEKRTDARKKAIFASPKRPDGIVLPHALDRYDASPWRWLGPGIHLSRLKVPEAPEATLILMRVAANKPMPEHGHGGTEYTQVLTGSLIDGEHRLIPGDLMEAGEDLEHQPVAGPEGDCICLAAVEGRLRIGSFIGRTYLSLLGL